MNISILTHPLGANYGGILQAFALSTYLKKQGHKVYVLNRNANMPFLKRIFKLIMVFFRNSRYNNPRYQHLQRFVKQYIPYSKPLYTSAQMAAFIRKNNVQASIVGSDQVWRASFAMKYDYDYFLNFVPTGVKHISYAASFGLSKWEYNERQTRNIKQLVKNFDAVSVRESEGVTLCQMYLDVKAEHVLDPTMLLHAEEYNVITSPRIVQEDYIFVYWLGSVEEKQKAIAEANIEGRKLVDLSLRGNEPLMPIEDWLSYIKYAYQVLTDSFHGCVFSILFKRQFTIYANNSGGNGRLMSLFAMLGIDLAADYIDYDIIDKRLEEYRGKSYTFLKQTL
jgi:hypothetical protein